MKWLHKQNVFSHRVYWCPKGRPGTLSQDRVDCFSLQNVHCHIYSFLFWSAGLQKTLVDQLMLSFCDALIVTPGSTFGSTAAFLAGMIPYYVDFSTRECRVTDLFHPPSRLTDPASAFWLDSLCFDRKQFTSPAFLRACFLFPFLVIFSVLIFIFPSFRSLLLIFCPPVAIFFFWCRESSKLASLLLDSFLSFHRPDSHDSLCSPILVVSFLCPFLSSRLILLSLTDLLQLHHFRLSLQQPPPHLFRLLPVLPLPWPSLIPFSPSDSFGSSSASSSTVPPYFLRCHRRPLLLFFTFLFFLVFLVLPFLLLSGLLNSARQTATHWIFIILLSALSGGWSTSWRRDIIRRYACVVPHCPFFSNRPLLE